MSQLEAVRTSPAAADAEAWAPQAHARARQLEERAKAALAAGDAVAAEALAEQALATHEHARVLTRLARAERRRLEAETELAEQRQALAELQAQQQRLTAEAAGLELRARVVRGALPVPPHEAAEPERQLARRRAAGALATQGRLLCMAARLLGDDERIGAALGRLDQVDQKLAAGANEGVLESAMDLRSECSRIISSAREKRMTPAARGASQGAGPAVSTTSAAPPADILLTELSEAGAEPSRDERGVSVVLRGVFKGDGSLSDGGRAELKRFADVAKAHPEFPLLVVSHSGVPAEGPALERRLATVTSELAELGLPTVAAHAAGARQPLLPPQSPRSKERNERLELVFVAPAL